MQSINGKVCAAAQEVCTFTYSLRQEIRDKYIPAKSAPWSFYLYLLHPGFCLVFNLKSNHITITGLVVTDKFLMTLLTSRPFSCLAVCKNCAPEWHNASTTHYLVMKHFVSSERIMSHLWEYLERQFNLQLDRQGPFWKQTARHFTVPSDE